MFKRILVAVFAVLAAPSAAQDITIPMHQIGNGSIITIRTDTNNIFLYRILGQTGPDQYVYETFNGNRAVGAPAWVNYTDSFGNLVARVDARGGITSWSPHRCNRTLGTCSYTELRPDGSQAHFTRVTSPIVGGFSYILYDSTGAVAVSGQAILNELGWTQWGTSQRQNEAATTVEILSAHYQ